VAGARDDHLEADDAADVEDITDAGGFGQLVQNPLTDPEVAGLVAQAGHTRSAQPCATTPPDTRPAATRPDGTAAS
jgi:hypothetical protein